MRMQRVGRVPRRAVEAAACLKPAWLHRPLLQLRA
jgi:hypothetical protein